MKTLKLTIIALLFSILLPLNYAHADASPYAEAYAVGSDGSTALQTTFTLSQQPFIYVKFFNDPSSADLSDETTLSTFQAPGGSTYTPTIAASTSNQIWISLTPSQWSSVAAPGTWQTTESSSGTAGTFFEQASFKVTTTPEPMSVLLFFTGAFLIAIILRRRKAALAVQRY